MGGSTALDAAIIGAGFGGMYAIRRLRDILNLNVRCFEASAKAGGTWNWNRYPGARVDVRSAEYSYSFDPQLEQDWEWSEVYAAQPELMTYVEHVLDRYDLRRSIDFSSRLNKAVWDEDRKLWKLTVAHYPREERSIKDIIGGEREARVEEYTARFVVFATGCLSAPNLPKWPGFETYKGDIYHTARWPEGGVDFTGKKVAVIGTGSSAVQSIPVIAKQAESLTVFQRTATYSIPAHNRPLTRMEAAEDKAHYAELRARQQAKPGCFDVEYGDKIAAEMSAEEAEAVLEKFWRRGGLGFAAAFLDSLTNLEANKVLQDFVRKKIHEIVKDQATADLLSPTHVVACKRLCIDTGYYETYNLPSVKLVSVKDNPIKDVGGPDGTISLTDGSTYGPFDAIVCATGFDAMTGALLRIDIRGVGGQTLKDKWAAGPATMLGLMIDGFPNAFMVSGPGSPSVLTNMIPSIEQMVEYISDTIKWLIDRGYASIDPTPESVAGWVGHVNEVSTYTLFPTGCNSWYLGANIPGKPRVFLPYVGGYPAYKARCDEIHRDGYPGFVLAK
ncbi:cyclohexanone monooxygenase [Hyaloraphidium curvatum]|nr:cyclohexanone monooxygenase [Hyaloraphidium curvatum]